MGHLYHLVGIEHAEFEAANPAQLMNKIGVPSDLEAHYEWGQLTDTVIELNDTGDFDDAIGMVRTAFEEMDEGIFGKTREITY
jgi:hypothetical protein